MAISSIHFSIPKSTSEAHNEREVELDYNFPELTKNNESWKVDEIKNRVRLIKKKCKEISGRKMSKSAMPIREAVVNLNANHGMADLQKLAKDLEAKKGIKCFQIHIHRDEGKTREELNYHAHLLFDWQDQKTGKTVKLNRRDLSEIQTLVADELGMERGVLKENSNRERLEPIEYKRQQEELRVLELQKKKIELSEDLKKIEGMRVKCKENTTKIKSDLQAISATLWQKVTPMSSKKRTSNREQLKHLREQFNSNAMSLQMEKARTPKLKLKLNELEDAMKPERLKALREKAKKLPCLKQKSQKLNAKLNESTKAKGRNRDQGISM